MFAIIFRHQFSDDPETTSKSRFDRLQVFVRALSAAHFLPYPFGDVPAEGALPTGEF